MFTEAALQAPGDGQDRLGRAAFRHGTILVVQVETQAAHV